MRKSIALVAAAGAVATAALTQQGQASEKAHHDAVEIEILAPEHRDVAGVGGIGWAVDLRITYRGHEPLARAGFTAPQLTGPAVHNNVAPFPGTFSPGRDDRLSGLVVLSSTTTGFSGPGTNLANLFNTTAVTDNRPYRAAIQDTWLVGAPLFGVGVPSTLTVAVVDDLDGNGVYDDAPAVVPDSNGDGVIDRRDVAALGTASDIERVRFTVSAP